MQSPFIYFDDVAASGMSADGIGVLTLEAMCVAPDGNGQVTAQRTVVAHLRMGRVALAKLREAINRMDAGERAAVTKN